MFVRSAFDAIGFHFVFLHLSNHLSRAARSTAFQSHFGRFFEREHSNCGVQQRAVRSEANAARLPSVSIQSNEKADSKYGSDCETARLDRSGGDWMACESRVSCGDSEVALL